MVSNNAMVTEYTNIKPPIERPHLDVSGNPEMLR